MLQSCPRCRIYVLLNAACCCSLCLALSPAPMLVLCPGFLVGYLAGGSRIDSITPKLPAVVSTGRGQTQPSPHWASSTLIASWSSSLEPAVPTHPDSHPPCPPSISHHLHCVILLAATTLFEQSWDAHPAHLAPSALHALNTSRLGT